jgi:hypothetical protein
LHNDNVWTIPEFEKFLEKKSNKDHLYKLLSGTEVTEESWNRITYLSHFRKITHTTDLGAVAQILTELQRHKSLDLIDNGPAYHDIISDPFRAFQLKTLPERNVLAYPSFQSLKLAATRNYKGQLEVLISLWDFTPFKAIEFNKLKNFKPYQAYISDYGRATNLYEAIKRNPKAFKTFTSNSGQMKFLKLAAYSHLIPNE